MIIVLNNKSNLLKNEYQEYLEQISKIVTKEKIVLCPTYLNIPSSINCSNVEIGSQNISAYEEGAHTGEISAKQLSSYGVKYAIIGHSERRTEQKETSLEVNRKIKKALAENITPILCIGETKNERDKNLVKKVLTSEIEIAFKDLTNKDKAKIIVAYEPIWSIGTGVLPTNSEIEECINLIRKLTPDSKILYGGSVNDNNIDNLKKIMSIDGYLIGGMSLDITKFNKFLDKIN